MDNTTLFFLIFGLSGQNQFLDKLMIFGAEYAIYVAFILMFVLLFKGGVKEKKALIISVIAFPLAILIIKIIHIFFFESRPYVAQNIHTLIAHEADASFPSRHASIISAITSSYIYYKSKWAPLFLTLLILIGLGRVYVGVHYPVDILGGILVGIVSVLIAKLLVKLLKNKFTLG